MLRPENIFLLILSYLSGSIPFGLIFSKVIDGVDPRKKGSGNIGFTNILRIASKKAAILTLVCDVSKGFIPVYIAKHIGLSENWILVAGFISILGHIFPATLRFKGGKGIATSFGVIFAAIPMIATIILTIWLASLIIWKYSSLSALNAFTSLPLIILINKMGNNYLIFSILLLTLIIYKHKDNIYRLIEGREHKMGSKR